MLVKIKRQESPVSSPYWQSFEYKGDMNVTVSAVLDWFNAIDDLYDAEGNQADHIQWACSCMQNMCGACAMVINGRPALACDTFLRDLKGKELVLEPLTKFPVAADLIVDRSIIEANLQRAEFYLGEYKTAPAKEYDQLYSVARCLKCGLCLEACINYHKGENFFGGLMANEAYFLSTQSSDRKQDIKKEYEAHVASGCSKSNACGKICPVNISFLTSMMRMNKK